MNHKSLIQTLQSARELIDVQRLISKARILPIFPNAEGHFSISMVPHLRLNFANGIFLLIQIEFAFILFLV